MTLRQNKMKKELFRIVKEILLYDISNPVVSSISITAVEVSKDMSYCTIFYVKKNRKNITNEKPKNFLELEKSLLKMTPYVKRKISNKMRLKKIPELLFKYDNRPEYIKKINNLLGNIEYSNQNEELLSELYDIEE